MLSVLVIFHGQESGLNEPFSNLPVCNFCHLLRINQFIDTSGNFTNRNRHSGQLDFQPVFGGKVKRLLFLLFFLLRFPNTTIFRHLSQNI